MVIKEFRKILSQKWIIYILFVLCFVNIFLDTRNVEITSGFVIESNVGDVENIIIPTVFTCNPGIIPVIVPMIIPNIKVIKISNIIY